MTVMLLCEQSDRSMTKDLTARAAATTSEELPKAVILHLPHLRRAVAVAFTCPYWHLRMHLHSDPVAL